MTEDAKQVRFSLDNLENGQLNEDENYNKQ